MTECDEDYARMAAVLWHGPDAALARDWLAMRAELDRLRGEAIHDDDDGETD